MTDPQEPARPDPFRPPDPFRLPAPRSGEAAAPAEATDGFGTALPPPTLPYGAAAPASAPGSGTAAVVLGVLALLLSWTLVGGVLLGAASLVLGLRARRGGGGRRATAGAVLGGLGLLVGVGFVVAAVVLLTSDTGERLRDCLDRADGDRQARSQCEQELKDSLSG